LEKENISVEMEKIILTVITVSFNSKSTIKQTIESVLGGKTDFIEYIVVDGKSQDGTSEIIEGYKSFLDKIIIEADLGVYDAMNKGAKCATGKYLMFLNSDDFLVNNKILSRIINTLIKNNYPEYYYADLYIVDKNNTKKIMRKWITGRINFLKLVFSLIPPHPTFIVKRSIFNKLGGFNLKYNYSADYELMLQVILGSKNSFFYDNSVIINMRNGGLTGSSGLNILKQNKEIFSIYSKHISFLLFPVYLISKFFIRIFQRII